MMQSGGGMFGRGRRCGGRNLLSWQQIDASGQSRRCHVFFFPALVLVLLGLGQGPLQGTAASPAFRCGAPLLLASPRCNASSTPPASPKIPVARGGLAGPNSERVLPVCLRVEFEPPHPCPVGSSVSARCCLVRGRLGMPEAKEPQYFRRLPATGASQAAGDGGRQRGQRWPSVEGQGGKQLRKDAERR